MQVVFENDWYSPFGLIRKDKNGAPVEVDDVLESVLPSTAQVVGRDYKKVDPKKTLPTPENVGQIARKMFMEQQEANELAVQVKMLNEAQSGKKVKE